jgi:hypothetical protein
LIFDVDIEQSLHDFCKRNEGPPLGLSASRNG